MLITGSLGSGKTTLLKRILATARQRIAVVMNEFGEIAIDSRVIQGHDVQIVELAGGCVCCSMSGEFEAAVKEILATISPQYIVLEATGVAEADALVYEVEDNLPQVRLDSVVCLVDAYLTIKYPHLGCTTRSQLEAADVIMVNKVDLVTQAEVEEVERKVREINPNAFIFKTVGCDLDADVLLGVNLGSKPPAIGRVRGRGIHFQSFGYTTRALLGERKFLEVISRLPASVYRAKGFVRFEETCGLFNYVAGRIDLDEHPASDTRVVFIGPGVAEHKDAILAQLRECEIRHAL